MAKKKIVLTFPPNKVGKPITYHLVKDFDLVINILRAEIYEEKTGRMVLEVQGEQQNIDSGIKFLEEEGVAIQEAARDIILDTDVCIDCGACTSVCLPDALKLDKEFNLVLDKEKCILCELCVTACPVRVIEVKF